MIDSKTLKHYEDGRTGDPLLVVNGKVVSKDICGNPCWYKDLYHNYIDFRRDDWEIYQEPKKRLLTAKELFEKGAKEMRRKKDNACIHTLFYFGCLIGALDGVKTIRMLDDVDYNENEWTADRKTWHDFYTTGE